MIIHKGGVTLSVMLPDGVVSGTINANGTKASVSASVSCSGIVPTGSISGTLNFFSGGPTNRNIKFASNTPVVVATLKTATLQSVGTEFRNVTIQENEFTPITGCTAFLDATRLSTNLWIGSLTIVCPNGTKLFVFGTFTGSVRVNRQVFCRPLL